MKKGRLGTDIRTSPTRVDEETSRIYIAPVVELRTLPKFNHKDIDALEERIDYFFDFCVQRNLRPGVALLASAIGVTEQTLKVWEREGGRRAEIIEMAKENINTILEQLALNNAINPTTLIWLQKNHFGYQDNVIVESRHTTGLDALPTKEEIMKRLPSEVEVIEDAEFREVEDDDGEEGTD